MAAAASSIALADEGEPLIAVLTADALVVSVAIFAAAVAAAIYAKPAYDQAIASLRPAEVEIVDFQLDGTDGAQQTIDTLNEVPVFRVSSVRPYTIRVCVTITNVGAANTWCSFNLWVPASCDLQPCDPAKVQHEVMSRGKLVELTPGEETQCKVSTAEGMLYRGYSKEYNAEITLPTEGCPSESGWPMRLCCFGPNERGFAVEFAWWVA